MDQNQPYNDHDKKVPKEAVSKSRRASLKKIAVGGGIAAGAATLPSKWAKPVIDRVLVPAHAQTSLPQTTTTLPPEEPEKFEGGTGTPDTNLQARILSPQNDIHVIGTVKDGEATIEFVSTRGADGTCFGGGSASVSQRPIEPGYHYRWKAVAKAIAGETGPIEADGKFEGDCLDPPPCSTPGELTITGYAKGSVLNVAFWDENFTLELAGNPVLPGLTACYPT